MALPHIYALVDTRWSNPAANYNGIWLDINNGAGGTAVGAFPSYAFLLTNNLTQLFAVDPSGVVFCRSTIQSGGNITSAGGFGAILNADGSGNPEIDFANFAFLLCPQTNNVLEQRNGTNPQTFNIYNTYTDSTDYERLTISWSLVSNIITIAPQASGTGTLRGMSLGGNGSGQVDLNANGTIDFNHQGVATFWSMNGNGLIAGTDNTYDIGANGANRPRNLYTAGTAFIGGAIQGSSGSTQMILSSDGSGNPYVGWGTSGNVVHILEAANLIAQRNGVSAQGFRVYNTFTDSADYERGIMDWNVNSNRFSIGTQASGTGSLRPVDLYFGSQFQLKTNVGIVWQVDTNNFWTPGGDNSFDIGQNTTPLRVRNFYQAGFHQLGVLTIATITASISQVEGTIVGCNNAATVAAGATVAASGTGHALLYYDGTQWKACN